MTLNMSNIRPTFRQKDTEEDKRLKGIKEAISRGRSVKSVAIDLGVSESKVLNLLNKNGTCVKELRG